MRLRWDEVGPAAFLALLLQWPLPFLFGIFGVSLAGLIFIVIASLPYSLVRSIWLLQLTFEVPHTAWVYLLNQCFYTAVLVVVIRATRFFAAKLRGGS